jgi:glycerate kinase
MRKGSASAGPFLLSQVRVTGVPGARLRPHLGTLDPVPPTVVLAPDSFKGSLDAAGVAAALAEGWRRARPDDELIVLPQADGGEGTLDAIAAAVPGAVLRDAGDVTGPDGRPTPGRWLALPGGTAVVELAQPSGLPLMPELDPLGATTRGLGEVIAAALDDGATALVIGLGGSASTDGGAGALRALGIDLRDAAGAALADGGGALARLHSLDRSRLRPPPPDGVRLLSDVTAPLLGPLGAAAVFGPQKGATPAQVAELDDALATFAGALGGDPATPGTGAAGGTGYGFVVAWGAHVELGSAAIGELTGLTAAIARADVVVTGEGRYDLTSATGKVVGFALERLDQTAAVGVVVAGQLAAEPSTPSGRTVAGLSLTELAGSVEAAIADPTRWLREAGERAARDIR